MSTIEGLRRGLIGMLFSRALVALACTFLVLRISAFTSEAKAQELGRRGETSQNVTDAILFYGQSNAGGGGHARPVLTDPVFANKIFTFRTSRQTYGTQLLDPARLQGIGAIQDDERYAPYPATAMAYALGRAREHTANNRSYFMHTIWYGGQPLTSFLRGTTPWSDLSVVARRMMEVLSEKGLSGQIAALMMIQGESGPPGRENYASKLREFLDDVLPELKAQSGQARSPVAILLQTNESNVQIDTALGVALAQWDVAHGRPQDTALAGPMYQFPLSDAVHQSAEGRLMLGDLLALVFDTRVKRGEIFEPLHPIEARRVNDTVVIAFARPHESQPLQWDRTWVPSVPDYGFQLADEMGPVAIVAVEISGSAEVTLKLGRQTLGRRLVVRYAMDQPRKQGWAPGRGQLVAPTMRRSAFIGFGYRLPETVAHYAIRFELPVQ